MWDEITYPFLNEFRNWLVISSHTLQDMWLLIHAGIKVLTMLVKGATGVNIICLEISYATHVNE